MGESEEPKKAVLAQASAHAMVVDTMGGRVHVRWDEAAQATPHGQIEFFVEFLATAGVFDSWVQDCPLHHSSPNASHPRDVLGILAGSKRYAHIAGVRGDAVAAKALGLRGMVSEDSVHRALAAIVPAASDPWMRGALTSSVRQALDRLWVLNMEATIKPLYTREDWTRAAEASRGWQAIEDDLLLSGWSKARRVVVLRRRVRHDTALAGKKRSKEDTSEQLVRALPHDEVQVWEYTVLAANATYDIAAIGQLYRDRCDGENGFEELKNQWGWGGFTTQDMRRRQVTTGAVAQVYNSWSRYERAANSQARREALTSRLLLLAGVCRATSGGNQTMLYLTSMHAEAGRIKSMIASVHAATQHVKPAAERLPKIDRWRTLLADIGQRIVGQIGLQTPRPPLTAPGQLLLLGL